MSATLSSTEQKVYNKVMASKKKVSYDDCLS